MANENCLANFKCPSCGWTHRFHIEGKTLAVVEDDGAVSTDIEWVKDSYCMCTSCSYEGVVSDFETEPVEDYQAERAVFVDLLKDLPDEVIAEELEAHLSVDLKEDLGEGWFNIDRK